MKVLEVIQDNRFGGIAARSLCAAQALRSRGVDFHFVLPTDEGEVSERCRALGFRVTQVLLRRPNPRRLLQTLLWLATFPISVRSLCRVIRQEKTDVVHANGMICLQAVVASHLMRVPLIWHLAGTTMYPRAFCRVAMYSLVRKAHVVFIARNVRRYFLRDAPVSVRETIIHEPVDLQQIDLARSSHVRGSFRTQIGIPQDGMLVCAVANISPIKGIDVLLQAAVRIRQKHPNAYFVVVGKKLSTQQRFITKLENRITASGMSSHFILAGYRSDVYHLLQDCDVFVLPSLSEGTPISILEAMAIGIPVIATHVGGIPEQIEHGKSGLIVSRGDPDSLADGLEQLLGRPELRAQLAQHARAKVRAEFSLEIFSERFLDLLRRCTPQSVGVCDNTKNHHGCEYEQ